MKKFLLILTALTLSLGTAMADANQRFSKQWYKNASKPLTLEQQLRNQTEMPSPLKAATRADEGGFTIMFCDDLYSWTYFAKQNKLTYKCYIYITPEMATSIAGNKVTSIIFSCTTDFTGANDKARTGSVFVTESLDGAPTTSTACTIEDCYAKYQQGKDYFQVATLDEPYVIKEGVGFFFGYEVNACRYSLVGNGKADYPISFDYQAPNGFSGFVDVYDDKTGEMMGTIDMANDVGTNLFLGAQTVGEATGFLNLFSVGNLITGAYTLPVFDTPAQDPLIFPIKNIGSNTLESFEYSLDVNGQPGEDQTMEISVKSNTLAAVTIPAPEYIPGYNTVRLNVKKINGVEVPFSTEGACIQLANGGYDRKFVVEEGTGTWCGWCPRGIVGLKNMSERYPDTFIGIAVHADDNLQSATYAPLTNYFGGFPSSIINRDGYYFSDPGEEDLQECYKAWEGQRSPAKLKLAVEASEKGYKVLTETTFEYDETNAEYRIGFAILENGLMDKQANNYAGNSGSLEWWGDQGESVLWEYEDTAIDIFDLFGIEGSIPTTIKAGEKMTYQTEISGANVTDKSASSIVALLFDARTGVILNAAKVTASEFGDLLASDGITDVEMNDATIPAAYYNLQGIRVQNPQPGSILIHQQGNKVVKTVVR